MKTKLEIDERIAPKELVVGITGELCYVTYYQTKGKKRVLNSEKSWTDWSSNSSNPLVVENKFSSGFKLAGVNSRWSRNASNSENMLIRHPLFKKSFEISMSRFMEIAKICTIEKGEFLLEMIMTNQRDIITRIEYERLIELKDKEEAKKKEIVVKNNTNKIASKEQKVGRIYTDIKSNSMCVYLGSIDILDRNKELECKKHVYFYLESGLKPSHKKVECVDWSKTRIVLDEKQVPSIVDASGYVTDSKCEYVFRVPYFISVVKSKKIVSENSFSKKDFFETYSEEDWKIIEEAYSESPSKDRWGDFKKNYTKTDGCVICNFKKEYEESKVK